MIRKFLLKQKLTSFCVFRNKTRMILTILGICIGLFFYLIGNAAIDAYLGTLYDNVNAFDSTGYIIAGTDKDVSWLEESIISSVQGKSMTFSASSTMRANEKVQYKSLTIDHFAVLIGSPDDITQSSVYAPGTETAFLGRSKILYGRDLTNDDSISRSMVCVLEKSTAMVLFQKENATGEILHIQGPNEYYDVEVVGIMEDLHPKKQENFVLNKLVSKGNGESTDYVFSAYIPLSTFEAIETTNGSASWKVISVASQDKDTIERLIALAEEEIGRQHRNVSVISQSSLRSDVAEVESNIKGVLALLMVFILVFSSFIILTIFLFSVKERVYEIGIRRALGASQLDITIQFVWEGLILSVLSASLAVFGSIVVSNYVSYILKNVYFLRLMVRISPKLIFATFGISLFQGILFSFFPAIIASHIRPTEAIRWD